MGSTSRRRSSLLPLRCSGLTWALLAFAAFHFSRVHAQIAPGPGGAPTAQAATPPKGTEEEVVAVDKWPEFELPPLPEDKEGTQVRLSRIRDGYIAVNTNTDPAITAELLVGDVLESKGYSPEQVFAMQQIIGKHVTSFSIVNAEMLPELNIRSVHFFHMYYYPLLCQRSLGQDRGRRASC